MTAEERGPRGAQGGGLLGPRLVAIFLLALSAILIVSAIGIARGGGYTVISPATIPLLVSIGLLVLAATFVLRTTLLPDADLAERAAEEERATHWPTVGLVAVALVAYGVALDGLGYVVATGLFLPVTARILGSRSPIRDLVVGVGLALVVYIGFTEFLGVRLPAGILDLVP
ncbi:MAG: tripartite tricarboxylate transporter TctB family protein [Chloroflexota bacterium]|nr:tripartite tricarboxylate transporter TctB family protein [Chloroflexota bacterium]